MSQNGQTHFKNLATLSSKIKSSKSSFGVPWSEKYEKSNHTDMKNS